jgi:hypothetical protein
LTDTTAAILDIFQKYPPTSSVVSITLHEVGKVMASILSIRLGRQAACARLTSPSLLLAESEQCRGRSGKVFDSVTVDL